MIHSEPLSLPSCESPKVILSFSVDSLLRSALGCSLNGVYHHCTNSCNESIIRKAYFLMHRIYKECKDDLVLLSQKLSYLCVFNVYEHDWQPLFKLVPCRHCDLCRKKREEDWSLRALLESQVYTRKPYFICLTYDNEHLPFEMKCNWKWLCDLKAREPFTRISRYEDGTPKEMYIADHNGIETRKYYHNLVKEDYQLFLMRFRQWLRIHTKGQMIHLRYIVAGHYGSLHGRPHFHFVFWFKEHYLSEVDEFALIKLGLQCSWQKGIVDCQIAKGTNNVGAYCAGYLAHKDSEVAQGYTPTFIHASNGCGGIGQPFIDSHPYLFDPRLPKFTFLDKWSGKVVEKTYCSFLISKIHPSFSRYISRNQPTFKEDYRLCVGIYNDVLDYYAHYYSDLTWITKYKLIFDSIRFDPESMPDIARGTPFVRADHSFYDFKFFDEGKKYLLTIVKYISQYAFMSEKIYNFAAERQEFFECLESVSLPQDITNSIRWAKKSHAYRKEHATF